MFPVGYTHFSYGYGKVGSLPRIKTAKITSGLGNLEAVLDEGLHAHGLEFQDGNLTIDKERGEVTIFRSLVLSEQGPFVFYKRLYPQQEGFEEMLALIDRTLEKAYVCSLGDVFLSLHGPFEKYLVDNLDFTEKATFRSGPSSEAEVQGRVSIPAHKESVIPEEDVEYSVCLSDAFIEEIAKSYRKNGSKELSTRRRRILASKEAPLKVNSFLRAVDIRPASSKYETIQVYRNLKKCISFITDITFKSAVRCYSTTFVGLPRRRWQQRSSKHFTFSPVSLLDS